MPLASSNGIELEYESFGSSTDPALLLVAGMGAQLLFWHENLCERLAARGLRVVRFDNRDVGLSTRFDELEPPSVPAVRAGDAVPPYTLDDMADDTVGLLDALDIAEAHLLGASMGGYIAQLVAIRHPERVSSLTSLASGPGGNDMVFGPPPPWVDVPVGDAGTSDADRESAIEQRVEELRAMSSGRYFDADRARAEVRRALTRAAPSPRGAQRQAAAIHAAPSRLVALGRLRVPFLVVHGELDPVLPVVNAERIAAATGAELLVLPGLGHELPPQIWPVVIDAVCDLAVTRRAA